MYNAGKVPRIVLKMRGLKRIVMWHTVAKRLPMYCVSAFPKSGGTWYCQMLSGCLELPFARNSEPDRFVPSVSHGHYLYSKNFDNVSVLFRDGRDVMVSAYYHFLFFNEKKWHKLQDETRSILNFEDYDDIKTNLPEFIERYMYDFYPNVNFTRSSWTEFVESWVGKGVPIVKYEDLQVDAVGEMARMTKSLTGKDIPTDKIKAVVDEFSFENITKRNRGNYQKNQFERKGISGDWKNHFSEEACRVFDKYAGDALINAGYEPDRSWIEKQAEHFKTLQKA